jgi:methionyl-tRNA synthetase
LADVFGNLVNRCLAFAATRFDGVVPEAGQLGPLEHQLAHSLDAHLARLRRHHEGLALRKAADEVRTIWRLANAYLAEAAPWSVIKDDTARAATIVNTAINLVRVSALAAWPFIPSSAEKVLSGLGEATGPVPWPQDSEHALSTIPAGRRIAVPSVLFPKITVTDLAAAHAS